MLKPVKKVLGPYLGKQDGRYRTLVYFKDGTKKCYQNSRWIMMQHLNRELDPKTETVDHINGIKTDDRLKNLQILTLSERSKKDAKRVCYIEITCALPKCQKQALKHPRNLRGNQKAGKAGPFCSRQCAGKYGKMIQEGEITPLKVTTKKFDSVYFSEKELDCGKPDPRIKSKG